MPEVELTLVDDRRIFLQDQKYKLFLVKRFACRAPESVDPADIVAALMQHEAFVDEQMCAPAQMDGPVESCHGPFLLGALVLDDFVRVDVECALSVVHDFFLAEEGAPPTERDHAAITPHVLLPIQEARDLFQLTADESKHSIIGFVLWHYIELVAIASNAREVTLIVAFFD